MPNLSQNDSGSLSAEELNYENVKENLNVAIILQPLWFRQCTGRWTVHRMDVQGHLLFITATK